MPALPRRRRHHKRGRRLHVRALLGDRVRAKGDVACWTLAVVVDDAGQARRADSGVAAREAHLARCRLADDAHAYLWLLLWLILLQTWLKLGPGVPDEAAGEWNGAAVAGLAEISALLTDQYEEDRMPFAEALQKLEALAAAAEEAEEAAAGADAAPSGSVGDGEERCCIVCEAAPREVRFACGHALVCRGCLPVVVERHRKCPNCGLAFGTHPVVEQGEHVRTGPTFVLPV